MKPAKKISLERLKYVLAAALLAFGLIVSFLAYKLLLVSERNRIRVEFGEDADDRMSVIRRTLESSVFAVNSICRYFDRVKPLGRSQFTALAGSFLPEIQGLRSLAWIPRVPYESRGAFAERAKAEGMDNFRILEAGTGKKLVPASYRKEYFPVFYSVSTNTGSIAQGFDLGSDPARLDALSEARRTGAVAASGRIRLLSETGDEYGFLLVKPVFSFPSAADRQGLKAPSLDGFIGGIFRWKNIVEGSLAGLAPKGIDVLINDRSAPPFEQALYSHRSRIKNEASPGAENPLYMMITVTKVIAVGGREIAFNFIPRMTYIASRRNFVPMTGLLSGIALSLLLSFLFFRLLSERERISLLVEKRTLELSKSEERLALAIEGGGLGLWVWDIKASKLYLNEQWSMMLGYDDPGPEQNIEIWTGRMHPEDREPLKTAMDGIVAGRKTDFKLIYRMRTSSGGWKWIQATGRIFERSPDGKPSRVIGVHHDITIEKEYERRLEVLSTTDPLTNVYNRRYFSERLVQQFGLSSRSGANLSVVMVDIDHFKTFNDTHGHQAGDYLLARFMEEFRKLIRSYDVLARYGGEEFVLMSPDSGKHETLRILTRLQAVVAGTDIKYQGKSLAFTFSGGISDLRDLPAYETDPTRLVAIADSRMYKAKETGRNRIVVD